jgi:hypothetical protein
MPLFVLGCTHTPNTLVEVKAQEPQKIAHVRVQASQVVINAVLNFLAQLVRGFKLVLRPNYTRDCPISSSPPNTAHSPRPLYPSAPPLNSPSFRRQHQSLQNQGEHSFVSDSSYRQARDRAASGRRQCVCAASQWAVQQSSASRIINHDSFLFAETWEREGLEVVAAECDRRAAASSSSSFSPSLSPTALRCLRRAKVSITRQCQGAFVGAAAHQKKPWRPTPRH